MRKVNGVNYERAKMGYLQRKEETQRLIGRTLHESIQVFSENRDTVSDEQEGGKDMERFWEKLFRTNGNATLEVRKEINGYGMGNNSVCRR